MAGEETKKNASQSAGSVSGGRPQTRLVHAGSRRSQYGETSEAMFLTQGFLYDSPEQAEARFKNEGPADSFIYARYGNPTVAMFQDRLAAYEGAEACFATASGMAAMHASMFALLKAGDHVVASRALFGSCLYIIEQLLPRFGVESTLVDGVDLNAWENAVRPETKLFFLESPSNPTLEIIDIAAVAAVAHRAGAQLVVDNVFATPVFQRPIALGADIVMYSATKHIDGQGRVLGGALLGQAELIDEKVETYVKHTGGAMNPFTAWVMLKGMETLELRVKAQAETALKLAEAAAAHSAVIRAIHPFLPSHPQYELATRQMSGGGTVLSVDLKGGKAAAFAFLNAFDLIGISNNLGDAKSLATHPATTTHKNLTEEMRDVLGISDGLVRISVGLEAPEDLIEDLQRALDAANRVAAA
ncbi:MAG: O-succinylhomoserine sulfhydrylase [Neomegalonema sp.]|nr:O-succinylhomoserine sulfhydrylase [Neomegalonema sp.]